MSGLAVAVNWKHPDAPEARVRRMLAAMPHRAPDGVSVAGPPDCALGVALKPTTRRERAAREPLHHSGLWVVGDARLDNRTELAEALGIPLPPSDVELLLAGYAKWREDLANRLNGDFAFAIWNERDRSLYAARDAFGMRPLFFHTAPARLLMASEVDALLATGEVSLALEDDTVADFLARNRYRDLSRTFYREVRRLRPGHWLLATAERIEEQRYFHFPEAPCATKNEREDIEEFRRRFRQAVEDRLDAETPIVSELSGGLDSASVACMANEIRPDARVILASALYPGLSCDEQPFIEAVRARVRFESQTWNGREEPPLEPEPRLLAGPWLDDAAFPSPGARRRARAVGARVVLTGDGGDALLYEAGVFSDLAASGRLLRLARETLLEPVYAATPGRDLFLEGIRAAVPGPVRRAIRRLRPVRAEAPPAWVGPALRPRWRAPAPPSSWRAPSETQRVTWEWLTGPTTAWHLEVAELFAAREGLQLRCPFFDRRLAEWVLSIPWQRRLPRGRTKRLLREGMAGLLPAEVAARRQVTGFGELVSWLSRDLNLGSAAATNERPSARAGYVDYGALENTEKSGIIGARADWTLAADLRNIAVLDSWLSALALADRALVDLRRVGMSETDLIDRAPEATPEKSPARPGPAAYEPPSVERLGSLRDLLGKSGGVPDGSHNNPTRP